MKEKNQYHDHLPKTNQNSFFHYDQSRRNSEDTSSIFFEEESFIEKNKSHELLYIEPEVPPKVIGSVRKCYKVCSCMSSRLVMVLSLESVRFFRGDAQKQQPIFLIEMKKIKQIGSYRKKNQYFIKVLIKGEDRIDLRFSDQKVCREWVGYFHQVLEFHDFLIEKQHYSAKQTFHQFVKSVTSKNQTHLIKLEDSNAFDKNKNMGECENTTIIKKKISVVRLSDFTVTHRIGKGAFSTVFKAEKDGKIYALKQMSKDELLYRDQLKYSLTELNVLRRCQACPFIIPLYFAFQTEDYLYLALRYLTCGNLQELLDERGSLSYEESFFIIKQLVVAVQFLHTQNILYRDLKPDNILLTKQGNIYLIDFGLARQLTGQQQFAETFVGTPLYMIPQRLQGDGKVNYKGDIYGVGCIFYTLLHGKTPFEGQTLQSIMLNIKSDDVAFRNDLEPLAKDFLEKTLEKNPQKRIRDMSSHPIFEDTNWAAVKEQKIKSPLKIVERKISNNVSIKSINDKDYTDANYPNKKVNDWNFTVKS